MIKKIKAASLLLALLVIAAALSGCTIPTKGYADYDVSAYIRSLLNSSYYASHEEYMSYANTTEEAAQEENNDTVVANGATHFCLANNLAPTDEQFERIEALVKSAYAESKFTVNTQISTDTGYNIDVEINPITNFTDISEDIEEIIQNAKDSAAKEEYNSHSSSDEDEDSEDEEDSENSAETTSTTNDDLQYEITEKVILLLTNSLEEISYGDTKLISLEIRLDSDGNLSLNQTQIEEIDNTVIDFGV